MIRDISMQSGSQRTIDDDGLVDIDDVPKVLTPPQSLGTYD